MNDNVIREFSDWMENSAHLFSLAFEHNASNEMLENMLFLLGGDINRLHRRELLHPGILRSRVHIGESILYRPIVTNKVRIFDWLIDVEGIDLNFVGEIHGGSPLHYAVKQNRIYMIEKLLERGANWWTTNTQNKTSLELAIDVNAYEAVRTFVKHGARIRKSWLKNCNNTKIWRLFERIETRITLASAHTRVGVRSPIRRLSKDLLRSLCDAI